MYTTVMVNLDLFRDCSSLLNVAADLAERFDAEVIGVCASAAIQTVAYDAGSIAGEVIELDRKEVKQGMQAAEEQFRAAFTRRSGRLQWHSQVAMDSPTGFVIRQARCADLLMTSGGQHGVLFDSRRSVDTADLVMQAGRPVLIVPRAVETLAARSVVIAWKDTREARRAVVDALPFLIAAAHVTVAEIAEDDTDSAAATADVDDVAQWLRRHGVHAEGQAVRRHGKVAAQLLGIAKGDGADLLVAGAYGHSRFREWVLGGVTLDLLQQPGLCSLLSH